MNEQSAGRRLRAALEAWEGLGVRGQKTLSVFRHHVGQFEAMTGNPLLSAIDKPTASRFTADLQRWAVENRKTRETADNVLASIKALVNVAVSEGWMPANPFAGMAVTEGGKKAEQREPWTQEELPRLFASPIFSAYGVPPPDSALNRKAGLDAAYWVPLLCLFAGARPGEVCQIWTDDVSDVDDSEGRPLLVIEFRANKARGQSLKSSSSWRALPVHAELERLGFGDYWRAINERQGHPSPLFPAVPGFAALQATTAPIPGRGNSAAVLDTEIGLEWLSPQAALGMGFTQVVSSAFIPLGYRLAGSVEVLGLLDHVGLDVAALSSEMPWPHTSVAPGDVAAMDRLISLLGATHVFDHRTPPFLAPNV